MVVELYYDGRLVDLMAQPRTLMKEMSYAKSPQEEWDPDLSPVLEALNDFNGTLLPPNDAYTEPEGIQDLPEWENPSEGAIPVPVVPQSLPKEEE